MILPTKQTNIEIEPVQSILKAQASKHKGALIGALMNGGKISVDGFIIEFIANPTDFRTVQIYECAKGIKPQVQTFQRTKTVKVKAPVKKQPKQETIKVNTNTKSEDLF